MRSRSFFNEIRTILDELDNQEDLDFKVLFLDATDSELVARYKDCLLYTSLLPLMFKIIVALDK